MTTPFAQLGLPAALCAALDAQGIAAPFSIQEASIPDALAGRDVCAQAPTGSGKTLAFGLPLLALSGHGSPGRPASMVVVPTRELADQIVAALTPLARAVNLRLAAVYGGVGFGDQKRALRQGVDVIVGCPGRMEDLISQRLLDLRDVRFAVLDEADRMADVGFLPAVRRLLDLTSKDRQTLLFSATMESAVHSIIERYQHDPARHQVVADADEPDNARHLFLAVDTTERARWTAEAITHAGTAIVFCRTRRRADRIAQQLQRLGVQTDVLHGGRSQSQRNRALAMLNSGRVQALVATDVAARGIHVEGLACVVHFDAAEDGASYTHRSGRTGRAGAQGVVLSLVERNEVGRDGRLRKSPAPGVSVEPTTADDLARALRSPDAAPVRAAVATAAAATAPSTAAQTTAAPVVRSASATDVALADGHERGEVKFFNSARGFGFITRPDGSELFVHHSHLQGRPEERAALIVGQSVDYRVGPGRKGEEALDVRPSGGPADTTAGRADQSSDHANDHGTGPARPARRPGAAARRRTTSPRGRRVS